ncbi:MAG TPA: hypothetical protein VFK52_00100 [Nocardioidaceae bacterium]|nr:hypothetical protein [Nocardioidaceae bacterium]
MPESTRCTRVVPEKRATCGQEATGRWTTSDGRWTIAHCAEHAPERGEP